MQFQLPQNLQQELLPYDPELKKLVRQAKGPAKAKSTYPLGNVNDLIPAHIVSADKLQHAVDYINGHNVQHRFWKFTKLKTVEENGVQEVKECVHALLFHYESLWVAVWLPAPGEDYIYGYAHAFRDTASGRKPIPYHKINMATDDNSKVVKYGRSEFVVVRKNFTVDNIKAGSDCREWRITNSWGKGQYIYEATQLFEYELRKSIPTWTDSVSMFDRIKCKGIYEVFFRNTEVVKQAGIDPYVWQPSFVTFKDMIVKLQGVDYSITSTMQDRIKQFSDILHIIDTPFMRRWIQERMDQSIAAYNKTDAATSKDHITRPWHQVLTYLGNIHIINTIWPDCPIDYYQNYSNELLCIDQNINYTLGSRVINWLRQHMPVASYFQILRKFYGTEIDQSVSGNNLRHMISSTTGTYLFRFYTLRDTISMLGQLLNNDKEVQPPKRWRINEFHDMLQAETWKIEHPNAGLPQDLFPEPIKVELDDTRWSFFQPHDTHQLASWGQAVRNCVGSARNYADGVRKKQHFIVLCMVDGKPQFTVQLDVKHGVMNVKQIAGISNARLTEEQRAQYTEAFGLALQERNNQLASL